MAALLHAIMAITCGTAVLLAISDILYYILWFVAKKLDERKRCK